MLPDTSDIIGYISTFFSYTWWFFVYIIMWPIFSSTWRFWREEMYVHCENINAFEPTMVEIKIPREILTSPRAMEQVLTSIHQLKNAPGDVVEWWLDGEVTDWHSLEIVSLGGEVHLYMRITRKVRVKLVQAAFFAFYPDIEITEVDDYVSRLPSSIAELRAQGFELWGSELVLKKDDAYPIKTYLDFESPDENKQYDPVSAMIELLAKVHKEQIAAIQILIAPLDGDVWAHHKEHLVKELSRKEEKHHKPSLVSSMDFSTGPMPAVGGEAHGEDLNGRFIKSFLRSPGETDVLEAVEKNLSKPVFETVIRFIYLSPEPLFDDTFPRRGITGAFNQYAATDLNAFGRNEHISTRVKFVDFPYILPELRKEYRKARLLYNFRGRKLPPETLAGKLITSFFMNWNFGTKPFHMTTQCIATIFHPPTAMVLTGPHIKRMDSKKAGPPAGLAIFGDESEIERYQ